MDANNYTKAINRNGVIWTEIPGLSRTGSGITTMPVNKSFSTNEKPLPELEYHFYLLNNPHNDSVTVYLHVAPTHNISGNGLFYAIAIDDEQPQIIDIHKDNITQDWEYPNWFNEAVGKYSIEINSKHRIIEKGNHVLRLYMMSSGVVFQKLIIDNGGLKASYLGPPESNYK